MPVPKETYPEVTVRRSWIGEQATGATVLLLDTLEHGIMALPLSIEAIEILRQNLAKAEVVLRRGVGRA